jgi:hypothetical protein
MEAVFMVVLSIGIVTGVLLFAWITLCRVEDFSLWVAIPGGITAFVIGNLLGGAVYNVLRRRP